LQDPPHPRGADGDLVVPLQIHWRSCQVRSGSSGGGR
jgi:hypothetical protein